ncbi:ABC transporter permease subunit [Roseibacterium sp. SDUM158016]|uniref:ABC transporter permease n=1 Tax=Roseicyclus sediminis TaxID=2980997 RepID=UPI0021D05800|nr:ABC transporter permease subunit [Roseibacterium sp. SDUM158016]MCU4651793.1 ABC transporter permease subunit [Roseibacterium sp. SDUM158016]
MAEARRSWIAEAWPPALTLAALVAALEAAVAAGMTPVTIPAPSAVAAEFADSWGDLLYHLGPSVAATALGFLISASLAALLAGIGAAWRKASGPVMTFGILIDSTPLIAVAPILIVFVGGGMTLHVIVAATACFFPLLVGMSRGFRAVERNADELFHVLAASRWQRLVKLALPSALPYLFSGFKIAAPLAVLGTLIAEWMGAERGVGIMMIYAMFSFDVPQVWMTILAVCLMAIGGYGLFALIERAYLRRTGMEAAPT